MQQGRAMSIQEGAPDRPGMRWWGEFRRCDDGKRRYYLESRFKKNTSQTSKTLSEPSSSWGLCVESAPWSQGIPLGISLGSKSLALHKEPSLAWDSLFYNTMISCFLTSWDYSICKKNKIFLFVGKIFTNFLNVKNLILESL